jgi:hypothetical protein
LSGRERNALFDRKEYIETAKLFSVGNRRTTREVKHRLPAMILAQPAGLQRKPPRLGPPRITNKNFAQLREPLRKIGQ